MPNQIQYNENKHSQPSTFYYCQIEETDTNEPKISFITIGAFTIVFRDFDQQISVEVCIFPDHKSGVHAYNEIFESGLNRQLLIRSFTDILESSETLLNFFDHIINNDIDSAFRSADLSVEPNELNYLTKLVWELADMRKEVLGKTYPQFYSLIEKIVPISDEVTISHGNGEVRISTDMGNFIEYISLARIKIDHYIRRISR